MAGGEAEAESEVSSDVSDAAPTSLRRLIEPGYDPAWAWHRGVSGLLMDLSGVAGGRASAAVGRRLAVRDARSRSVRVADLAALAALADGTVASVVGRARGQRMFPFRIGGNGGRSPVAFVVRCAMRIMYSRDFPSGQPWSQQPGFGGRQITERERIAERWQTETAEIEAAHDFELAVAAGPPIAVAVEHARVMAGPLTSIDALPEPERLRLLEKLDLPGRADPAGLQALFLFDGQPVEIIGIKQTLIRPGGGRHHHLEREDPSEPTIAGTPERPLLIVPVSS